MAADHYTLGDQNQREAEAAIQEEIIALYEIGDDYPKATQYRDDPQTTMTSP